MSLSSCEPIFDQYFAFMNSARAALVATGIDFVGILIEMTSDVVQVQLMDDLANVLRRSCRSRRRNN